MHRPALLASRPRFAAFHFWFQALGLEQDTPDLGSVMAGFLTMLSIWALRSVGDVLRSRALLQGAVAGVPPVDGKWAAISGVIRSSTTLTSPLSRTSAVVYSYWIQEAAGAKVQSGTGPSSYSGMAMAACTISTKHGSYRLLVVPGFHISYLDLDTNTARRNAETHVAATDFEMRVTGETDGQTARMEWSDGHGVFRRDLQWSPTVNLARCWFGENLVAQGEQVCVPGLYSEALGGIVPDPSGAQMTELMRGDGEAEVRQLASRARNYTLMALGFAAAAAVICWAVIKMHWRP
jgi:hypothetical protein